MLKFKVASWKNETSEGWGLLKKQKASFKNRRKTNHWEKSIGNDESISPWQSSEMQCPLCWKKNCNFKKRNTELHTNTLWNVLNHLFTVLKHLKYLFWFSLCLPWDFNFWIITMDQTHLHTHFSYIGHAFECFKYLFWFCLSKVQAINSAGYVFQD